MELVKSYPLDLEDVFVDEFVLSWPPKAYPGPAHKVFILSELIFPELEFLDNLASSQMNIPDEHLNENYNKLITRYCNKKIN